MRRVYREEKAKDLYLHNRADTLYCELMDLVYEIGEFFIACMTVFARAHVFLIHSGY